MPITVGGDSDGDDVDAFENKSKRCDASIQNNVASAARRLFIVFISYIFIFVSYLFFPEPITSNELLRQRQ